MHVHLKSRGASINQHLNEHALYKRGVARPKKWHFQKYDKHKMAAYTRPANTAFKHGLHLYCMWLYVGFISMTYFLLAWQIEAMLQPYSLVTKTGFATLLNVYFIVEPYCCHSQHARPKKWHFQRKWQTQNGHLYKASKYCLQTWTTLILYVTLHVCRFYKRDLFSLSLTNRSDASASLTSYQNQICYTPKCVLYCWTLLLSFSTRQEGQRAGTTAVGGGWQSEKFNPQFSFKEVVWASDKLSRVQTMTI